MNFFFCLRHNRLTFYINFFHFHFYYESVSKCSRLPTTSSSPAPPMVSIVPGSRRFRDGLSTRICARRRSANHSRDSLSDNRKSSKYPVFSVRLFPEADMFSLGYKWRLKLEASRRASHVLDTPYCVSHIFFC